jgi:CheY-like chemotaxis protein
MDCFELRVSDDGSGIPQELLRQIFEPLFSTKAKNRGHGLGLFMVREFIVRTQAGLIVESAPGRTSFRILLPAHSPSAQSEPARLEAAPAPSPAPDAAPTASPNKAPAKVGEAQARVLLVEDDRRVRDALSRLLRIDGLEVETADNGQEALEQLAALTVPVDLVLSDIAMPVMDGLDLYAQLSEQYPHLPVILMTGQQAHWEPPLDGHGEPALILRKPIELGTLQLAIRNKIRHAKDHDGRL